MAIELTQADFTKIGDVAKHCNTSKLDIAINEAIEFDLEPVVCNLFGDLDENWTEADGKWADIIKPKTYENCAGYNTKHAGLKNVLVYYAYARYVMLNGYDDTPNGHVTKTDNFSIPKPFAEVKQFSSKYRDMAREAYKKVEAFIMQNREEYPGYDFRELQSCGCNGSCGSTTKAKGYGVKSKTIAK